jgi:hypothetical protein
VFFADPAKRPSVHDQRRTHALEIEQRSGFDIRSIYQAYEHGRGANYTWVFAHAEKTGARSSVAAQELVDGADLDTGGCFVGGECCGDQLTEADLFDLEHDPDDEPAAGAATVESEDNDPPRNEPNPTS